MSITIHHLQMSPSERVLFLCEELDIPYTLIKYPRNRDTVQGSLSHMDNGSPGDPASKLPIIEDPENGVERLHEAGAIFQYILARHSASTSSGSTLLSKAYGEEGYVDFIYWLHYANADFEAEMKSAMYSDLAALPGSSKQTSLQRMHTALRHIGSRLAKSKWLAGDDFTAADIMMVYPLTTQRYHGPLVSYEDYPNIVRFLANIGERPAYRRAMEKGDPGMKTLLGVEAPKSRFVDSELVKSVVDSKKTARSSVPSPWKSILRGKSLKREKQKHTVS